MTLTIRGPIPSKKSLYKRRGGHGLYLPEKTQQILDGIQAQLQAQWGGQRPMKHPHMIFQFTVTNILQDRDGMLVTCLDLMQGVVIFRDSVGLCNGIITLHPALVGPDPGAVIEILP